MFQIGGWEGAWRLVVPIYVRGESGRKIGTHALLDGGSTRHVVSSALSRKMEIKGEKVKTSVTTLDNVLESEREVADVKVEGLDGFCLRLRNAILARIVASEGDAPPKDSDIKGIEHLGGGRFQDFEEEEEVNRSMGIIIGAEHAWTWRMGERRYGKPDSVLAVRTRFEWGLIGLKARVSESSVFCCHFMSFQVPSRDNDDGVRYGELEVAGKGAAGTLMKDMRVGERELPRETALAEPFSESGFARMAPGKKQACRKGWQLRETGRRGTRRPMQDSGDAGRWRTRSGGGDGENGDQMSFCGTEQDGGFGTQSSLCPRIFSAKPRTDFIMFTLVSWAFLMLAVFSVILSFVFLVQRAHFHSFCTYHSLCFIQVI